MKLKNLFPILLIPLFASCSGLNESNPQKENVLSEYQSYMYKLNDGDVSDISYSLKVKYIDDNGEKVATDYFDRLAINESFYIIPPKVDGLTPSVPFLEGYMTEDIELEVKYSPVDVWDGTSKTAFSGEGSESSPYLIQSAAELAYLANQESSRASSTADPYAGKYFKLTKNIDLADHDWTPIATNNSANYARPFQATFDGDGHLIKGLYINKPSGQSYGLFGAINANGTIKNLNVEGNVTGYSRTSILLACVNATTASVVNCKTFGKLTSMGDKSNSQYAGGITSVNKGLIDGCTNFAEIYSPKYGSSGGIVGANSMTVQNCDNYGKITSDKNEAVTQLGGIAGRSTTANSTLINCNNYAKMEFYAQYCGGVAGTVSGSEVVIENCSNYGMIETYKDREGGVVGQAGASATIKNCNNYGYIVGAVGSVGGIAGIATGSTITGCKNFYKVKSTGKYIGGIAGNCYDSNMKIESCYNYGKIEGYQYFGGIAGYMTQDIVGCENFGKVTGDSCLSGIVAHLLRGRVDNSINHGEISGNTRVGGVVGYYWFDNKEGVTSYVKNCSNDGKIIGTGMNGGVVGHCLTGIVYDCSNSGEVYSTGSYVGGVVGHLTDYGTCYNSSNTGTITGATSVGGVIGYAGANTTAHDNQTASIVNGEYTTERVIGYQNS